MIKIIILLFIFYLITYPQSASIRINVTATIIDPVRIEVKGRKVKIDRRINYEKIVEGNIIKIRFN